MARNRPILVTPAPVASAGAVAVITALDDRASALAGPEPVTAFLEESPSRHPESAPRPDVPTVGRRNTAEFTPAESRVDAEGGPARAGRSGKQGTAKQERRANSEPKAPTRVLLEWIGIVAGALLVALVIKAVLLQAFVIPSRSMEPTLLIGDRVLVFRPSYRIADVDRGDVVVFERPEQLRRGGDDADLIKRVVGLPGETVEGRDGAVYVNDARLAEPWLPTGVVTRNFAPVTVPAGHLWVMGDNRDNSQDSRVFGTLDQNRVIGEAFVRWWPASRFGGL